MPSQTIRYESIAVLSVTPPADAIPFSVRDGQITVAETFKPGSDEAFPDEGEYRVIIESEVTSGDQVDGLTRSMSYIADDLDKCWIYGAGSPLTGKSFGIHLKDTQEGWTSNAAEVRAAFGSGEVPLELGTNTGRSWHRVSFFPLDRVWQVRKRLAGARHEVRSLIEFHYLALKNAHSDASFFFLAKGLEITRDLLPGRDDPEKQSSLPGEITARLRTSLHELFNLANNRRETRHAVANHQTAELHQRLTSEERGDFVHDSDRVLRGVVFQQLGLGEPVILEKGKIRT